MGYDVTIENVYIYSMWNNMLIAYLGTVCGDMRKEFAVCYNKELKKHNQCGMEEGRVFNRIVWLRERNDEKAKQLFIENEKQQKAICELKILNYEANIKRLEETSEVKILGG